MTPGEEDFLRGLGAGRTVYEAGALFGASTLALAHAARLVVSVDPHDGYPAPGADPTWEPYLRHIAPLRDRIQPVRARFQDAPPLADYGLAWADLTGERAVTEEFLAATSHVPLVAVHDYGRAGCAGATAAVDAWVKSRRLRATSLGTIILIEDNTWRS